MATINLAAPLSDGQVRSLKAGDEVRISGVVYTARDAAHKRLCQLLDAGQPLPVDFKGQIVFFVGPSPAPPGRPIGSAGPTTSGRMDAYSPRLIREAGLKGMIGKGERSPEVVEAMKDGPCVYFATTGGAGALLAKCVVLSEIVCYPDLGAEAIRRLEVRDFPAIVAIDCEGNSLYSREKR